MDKKIEHLINVINLSGEKIWYLPVRNKDSHKNYRDTILNRVTFDGSPLNVSYWAFRLGKLNEKNFTAMSIDDYVCFITRDNEGYEVVDSIGVLSAKYIDPKVGERNWNDSEFSLIVEFENVFVLENKLRLTYKRKKLNNILPSVPDEIFHNGYEMFRHWNLNERLSRTKLGSKLIEEETLIEAIKNNCGGHYLGNNQNVVSVIKEESSSFETKTSDLETLVQDLFKNLRNIDFKIPAEVSLFAREKNETDSSKVISKKINRSNTSSSPLSKQNQKLLGLMGEEYIYKLLCDRKEELFSKLGVSNLNQDIYIEWDNIEYKDNVDDFLDSSLGHDIRIITNDRTIRLEVKTSFTDAGFYSITRNELKEMAIYTQDYFVVKVNHLYKLANGEAPTVILENFPIANVIENLNRVKSMEVYL